MIWLVGYWPESEKHEFGLPVCLNGWPVLRQNVGFTNSAFQIDFNRKSGYVPERSSLESSFLDLKNQLTGYEVEKRLSKSDFPD